MAEIFRMTGRAGLVGLVCSMALAGCGGGGRPDGGCSSRICLDSSVDTGTVPPADGGMDTSTPGDAGMDTGSGPSCGDIGGGCDPTRGCRSGGCLSQRDTTIGGPTDPIDNGPDGGISFPTTVWAGGYCSPNFDGTRFMPSCDVTNADDPVCGDCGTCVNGGGTPPTGICLASCTASLTDNGTCRDGYDCNLTVEACFPGCGTDGECKTTRQNTNGIAGIQTPSDCTGDATRPAAMQKCGGDAMNFDHLVYDPTSTATCDPDTFRCNNPGTAGAQGGDMCTNDTMCEANGRCLDEASFDSWVGGSCTKFRCDLAGNECAGDAVCQERRMGVFLCLAGCSVADGSTTDNEAAWLTNRGGCREGYGCVWNGVGGAGTANNGACVPGNFNDVTTNNIGDTCTEDADCWSPFGQGLCLKPADDGTGFRGGYCTMLDCLAPGTPANVCGTTASCITLGTDITGCLKNCASADDCRPKYACTDVDGDPATANSVCTPNCTTDTDCRSTEKCSIPAGETSGDCVAR